MRNLMSLAVVVMAAPAAWADWGVSVNIGVGAPYYGYAPADVVYVERYVPAYDVPRIFVVARHARVRPALVVDYYRRYPAWGSVCSRFGVPVSVFGGHSYAPAYIASPPPMYYDRGGPPRGNAYGHYKYKGKHRGRWRD